MSSRRHTLVAAKAAKGLGKEPLFRYVITLRLSQPMIAAASATPARAGVTSTVSVTPEPARRLSAERHESRETADTALVDPSR